MEGGRVIGFGGEVRSRLNSGVGGWVRMIFLLEGCLRQDKSSRLSTGRQERRAMMSVKCKGTL
jgi:hypothetical protein